MGREDLAQTMEWATAAPARASHNYPQLERERRPVSGHNFLELEQAPLNQPAPRWPEAQPRLGVLQQPGQKLVVSPRRLVQFSRQEPSRASSESSESEGNEQAGLLAHCFAELHQDEGWRSRQRQSQLLGDDIGSSLFREEAIQLGRRISRIHKDLIVNPTGFVVSRIDPSLKVIYGQSKMLAVHQLLKVTLLVAIGSVLPWAWANTLMNYRCGVFHGSSMDVAAPLPDWTKPISGALIQGGSLAPEQAELLVTANNTKPISFATGAGKSLAWFDVDLHSVEAIAGFELTVPDGGPAPKRVILACSDDRAHWVEAADFHMGQDWSGTSRWELDVARAARFWQVSMPNTFTGQPPSVTFVRFFMQSGNVTLRPRHEEEFVRHGCVLEDELRSVSSMLLGVAIAVLSMICLLFTALATHLLHYFKFPFAKRVMFKPLLWAWYWKIGPSLTRMRFANFTNIFPRLYSPPSVLCCWLYVFVLLGYSAAGLRYQNFMVGAFTGWCSAELMLRVLNFILRPSEEHTFLISGAINSWTPSNEAMLHRNCLNLLHRLYHSLDTPSLMSTGMWLYVSVSELLQARELDIINVDSRAEDRHDGDFEVDSVGIIEFIAVSDSKGSFVIDLINERISTPIISSKKR